MASDDWVDLNVFSEVAAEFEIQINVSLGAGTPQNLRWRHRLRGTERWWPGEPVPKKFPKSRATD